ncbi:hypothetical protein [Oricola indica]|uniref:hypothetical protein n=1 Tax=Oricola indica TaxID=2872591 RepID=UPI001CBA8319|nr:hypothetical protein [Oricola indica]
MIDGQKVNTFSQNLDVGFIWSITNIALNTADFISSSVVGLRPARLPRSFSRKNLARK